MGSGKNNQEKDHSFSMKLERTQKSSFEYADRHWFTFAVSACGLIKMQTAGSGGSDFDFRRDLVFKWYRFREILNWILNRIFIKPVLRLISNSLGLYSYVFRIKESRKILFVNVIVLKWFFAHSWNNQFYVRKVVDIRYILMELNMTTRNISRFNFRELRYYSIIHRVKSRVKRVIIEI